MKLLFSFFLLLSSFQLHAVEILRLSTTTSTESSGLLAVLNPIFEKKYNARIDVIAVGTGKALKLGKNGDVDVVFVHAPAAELEFEKEGYGVDRQAVMHNDFILLGGKKDVASLKTAKTAIEALQKIMAHKAEFISRGDDSGTHKKEKLLWNTLNLKPEGAWYLSIGQGMAAVLNMANEKQAYTLTDRGTYLAFKDELELKIVFEGDKIFFNPYHIMAVNPKIYPMIN